MALEVLQAMGHKDEMQAKTRDLGIFLRLKGLLFGIFSYLCSTI